MHYTELKFFACSESRDWMYRHSNLTPKQTWEQCPRGDWLLYTMMEIGVPIKFQAVAALVCAEGAQHHSKDARELNLLVRRWIRGKGSKKNLDNAVYGKKILLDQLNDEDERTALRASIALVENIIDPGYEDMYYVSEGAISACVGYYNSDKTLKLQKVCAERIRQVVPFSVVEKTFKKYSKKYE